MQDYIKILAGTTLRYLRREDGLTEGRQSAEINQSSVLAFTALNSEKVRSIMQPGVIAEWGGRRYCICGDSGVNMVRSTNGVFFQIEMKEIWYLLSKKYVTAYNIDLASSSEFDHIDTHMVVLKGNETHPVYVNGSQISNPHQVGTAPYMFYSILHGTGWSLDAKYAAYWPDGKFDLETDKKSVMENIETLQSLFGGMLFWDSVNQKVALVDEQKYQVFSGFRVRYRHNLKGIERTENRNVTTRLYVYGNNNLNISAVNSGKEYIENTSYTTQLLEDVATNNDIYDQASLLTWGVRQSEILCRPRYQYNIDVLMNPSLEMTSQKMPKIGELAEIIDEEIVGEPIRRRVLAVDQNILNASDCMLRIGDVIETFEGKFRDVQNMSAVTNVISTSANQVVGSAINLNGIPISAGNITGTIPAARIDWNGAQGMTLNIGAVNTSALSIAINGTIKTVGAKTIAGQTGLFLYVEQ